MADMMKALGGAKKGPLGRMAQAFGLGGGMPSPEEIAAMQKQMGGAGGLPDMPPGMKLPAAPPPGAFAPKPGLPGLGGAKPMLPGLGGFNPFGKKK
jgi:signal recognition particle subunit SRP54